MPALMLWKKFDILDLCERARLAVDDDCYYARDYISHGGYGASDGNNLVSNFKKPVSKKGTNQWSSSRPGIAFVGACRIPPAGRSPRPASFMRTATTFQMEVSAAAPRPTAKGDSVWAQVASRSC